MDFAVLIPAHRPSRTLPDLVRGLTRVIVADDGSGPEFAAIFDELDSMPGVTVLRHALPMGRGAALKAGINYALCHIPSLKGLVTADQDACAEDIERVASTLAANSGALAVGCHAAAGPSTLSSRLLRLLTGIQELDRLTGIRGIPVSLLQRLLTVGAQGDEFEVEMLLAARDAGMELAEVPLASAGGAGREVRFNPLMGSIGIYRVLLAYAWMSLLTAVVDNAVFYFAWKRTGQVGLSLAIARTPSALLHYFLVRRRVFQSRESHLTIFPRYLLAAAVTAIATCYGIHLLHWTVVPAKLFLDSLFFLAGFAWLRLRVFDPARAERFHGRLIAVALAGLVILEFAGFRTLDLLRRDMWFPDGPFHLIQFAAVYAAFSAAILILVPWLFAWLVAAALAVLTAIIVGPLPLLATAFFLLSAWALGAKLLGPGEPLLSTMLGLAVYIFPMPFLARLPVNYAWVYAAALAIPVALQWRVLLRRPRLPSIGLRTWGERAAFAALVFFVVAIWFGVLKPEASADGLAMHLAIPADIAAHRALTFQPARFLWAVMPMGADFAYTIAYLLGGEFAAHLFNFAMLLAILALIYSQTRRYLPLALFASTPIVPLLTSSLYVENFLAAMLFCALAAIWKFNDSGNRRFLYAAAALAGAAISTKFGAIVIVLLAIPVAAFALRRHRQSAWPAALAILLLTAAPCYLIAYAKTGNPLFPFLNNRYHSTLLPPNAEIRDWRYRQPLTWNTPFDLTFRTARYYEGEDGSFGFQYLVMAPLAFLALTVAPRRRAAGAAAVSLGGILAILGSEPNARYLYPALPLLFVPWAALIDWASPHRRALFHALVALSAAVLVLNTFEAPGSGFYYTFYGPFTEAQRQTLIERTAPIRKIYEWLNREHHGAPVLLVQDSFAAGLEAEIYANHWHQLNTSDRLRQAEGPAGVRRLLEEWKVQYLIGRAAFAGHYAQPDSLRKLIDNCAVPELVVDEFYAARLEPGCEGPSVRAVPPAMAIVAKPGAYDDFDPLILFRGEWLRDDRFRDAAGSTITYTDAPGAAASFRFRGSAITWLFTRASNRGVADVTIDGVSQGRFDLYSSNIQWRSSQAFEHLGPGTHLLEIRATGEGRSEAEGRYIDVDRFEVKP